MTVLLVILGVAWTAVLLPPYLRRRNETADSITSFQTHLSTLRRAGPGRMAPMARPFPSTIPRPTVAAPMASPTARAAARRRRRTVLVTLAGAAAFTLLIAVAFGGRIWVAQAVLDAILVGYAYLLVQLRKAAAERAVKVRYLPTGPAIAEPTPAFALRRVAR
ncbi:MAG: hypothetical protein HYX34_08110 [Actinobacteria bacterium]|nr:hypothetical protein [Actinomycetota bacterium]